MNKSQISKQPSPVTRVSGSPGKSALLGLAAQGAARNRSYEREKIVSALNVIGFTIEQSVIGNRLLPLIIVRAGRQV